jgi:hypothetical protein
LSSDSEHDENEGMKTEYEREDPDYEPGLDKHKLPKKISKSITVVDKHKESSKHTTQNVSIETSTASNHRKEPDVCLIKTSSASPKQDKDKEKQDTRMDDSYDNSKQVKYKSSHHHKSSNNSVRSKDKEEYYKNKEKHRSSPHKKHSILLVPTNVKKDSELTFKLSSTTKPESTHISSLASTKDNVPMAVNDSSSTEAIKKMLSGEKPVQLEQKSQQQPFDTTHQLNKEKSVSHERKNANKLFPRPHRKNNQPPSDTSEVKQNQFQTNSGNVNRGDQKMDEQTKITTMNGVERDKLLQRQRSSNCNPIESHNLLGSIMTEMEKKS